MLIIMENRDIQSFLQAFFNFKAAGSADILQVDAAEAGSHPGDRLDDFFRILGIQADGNRVYPSEFLEKYRFPFHNRHGRIGADITQAENRGTVGNHRNGIGLYGIGISSFFIPGNDLAGLCHARSIGK